MYFLAYAFLLLTMLLALLLGGLAVRQRWLGRSTLLRWIELAQPVQTGLLTLSSLILLHALVFSDFSVLYVAEYTDLVLPWYYRITAFWAGQAGSLLFWIWCISLFGTAFLYTPAYRALSSTTRLHFWLFFLMVMAFFLLLVTCWSNPFMLLPSAPDDGSGLNPLLQNLGMIFHPPLLFMGYAGFTIPACLGLAQTLTRADTRTLDEPGWLAASRNFTLLAWLFLTAGILLGAWWSYLELGWGGYWAWDPVENASLIPWLTGTAFLHTSVVETRRNCLHKTNIFLGVLTLAMSFFATYLVRSGVIDSLHAFGSRGVGMPLLLFFLFFTALSLVVLWAGYEGQAPARRLGDFFSREGLLVMATWILLLLGLVILMATMWPVISTLWSTSPVGLEAAFYNRVCLPFFVLLFLLLLVCPWLQWKNGLRERPTLLALVLFFVIIGVGLWLGGMRPLLALVGAAAAISCAVGILALFFRVSSLRRQPRSWGAYGSHLGLALIGVGVAFSGPLQVEGDVLLKPGESALIGGYEVRYEQLKEFEVPGIFILEADLTVTKNGQVVGPLAPQRRLYSKYPKPFAEASTLSPWGGIGNEVYATLLGVDKHKTATLKLSVHPLVNWIWYGGWLLSLFPILGLVRWRRRSRTG